MLLSRPRYEHRITIMLQVEGVYLLVKGKNNVTAQQRVQKVLCGPLFHELHTEAAAGGRNLVSKVQGVEGDMELPGLGLSTADRQMLVSDVDVIIHSAADLTLDAHIQDDPQVSLCENIVNPVDGA
jgi:fatty acyl-CoA reductase